MRLVYWFVGAIISGITLLVWPLGLTLVIGNKGYFFFESLIERAKKIANMVTN